MKASFISLAVAVIVPAVSATAFAQQSAEDIKEDTRKYWCLQQETMCPLLCADLGKEVIDGENWCEYEDLAFECKCQDGLVPSFDEYSQTIPYFVCSENQQNCIAACGGATDCQVQCKKDYKCGAIDPTKIELNSTSTASTSSTAPTPTKTKASDDAEDDDSSSSSSSSSGSGFAKADSASTDDAEEEDDTEDDEDTSAAVLAFGSAYGLGLFSVAIAGAAALL